MVHALYLFCVVINGRAFIWMWTIVCAHESSWSISWPPAPSCPVQGCYSGPRGREPQLSCSFIFNQRRFWPGATLRIWSETFAIVFEFFISYYRCFWFPKKCAFAHRFLEHKRLCSSPSDLYRQYNCHQVLFLFCWTTVIRETRINKRIQTLFFLLMQRICDFHKNVAELWLFGSMYSINIINDGRLWPY